MPPIGLEDAAITYQRWCHHLVTIDWPHYFPPPTSKPEIFCIDDEDDAMSTLSSERSMSPILEEATKPQSDEMLSSERSIPPALKEFEKTRPIKLSEAVRLCQPSTTETPEDVVIMLDRLPIPCYEYPTRWSDLVKVTAEGVFSVRFLPANTPIGFYYGAPMSEDEFDALKYREGRASQFSLMYRHTVLDPTDDNGEPLTDITSPMFCPFHFINETTKAEATVLLEEGETPNQIVCWTRREIQKGEELRAWFGRIF